MAEPKKDVLPKSTPPEAKPGTAKPGAGKVPPTKPTEPGRSPPPPQKTKGK